jgi:predicted metalloprotease
MRWRNLEGQGNVEDRRARPGRAAVGGVGGVGLIVVLLMFFLGGGEAGDLGQVLSELDPAQSGNRAEPVDLTPEELEYASFTEAVLGDLDLLWSDVFSQSELTYHKPTMVIFRGFTDSACGGANEQVGPHYCPLDNTIYLDETFFDAVLESRLGAEGGDFAEAYVIAHEVGHHVQNELGISAEVRSLQQANPSDANALSVKLELQADCFAGVWAFTLAQRGDILDSTDIREALDAASAVGDDRIQQKTSGMINEETWTHGSAEQRVEWFTLGYQTGDPNRCNTFG